MAKYQACSAPKSWPTSRTFAIPSVSSSATRSGYELVDRVVALARFDLAFAAAARIECDHAVARIDERRNLVAPDRVVVGEAVHEQHVRALALDDDVERDIVDPHPAVVDCHVASGRDNVSASKAR